MRARRTMAISFATILALGVLFSLASRSDASDLEEILRSSPFTTTEIRQMVYGGCDTDPYDALRPYIRSAGVTPVKDGNTLRDGIDPSLACRLSKLFREASQRGCQVSITSAYRSEDTQRRLCGAGRSGCAPAGRSCHQYGLAVDVSSKCAGWLRKIAPEFQLVFPYYGEHIQCREHPVAACSPTTPPCNGGVRVQPDPSRIPPPSEVPDTYFVAPPGGNPTVRDELPSVGAPSSGITDAVRNFFNPPPAMPPPQPPPSQTQPPQPAPPLDSVNTTPYPPGTCSPQFYCRESSVYYRASTCIDQINQVCPGGCSNGVCIASSTSSSLLNAAFGATSSSQGNLPNTAATSALSAFEQISLLLSAQSGGVAATVTPITLTTAVQDAARIQSGTPQAVGLQPVQGSLPLGSQQTFTSGDLRANTFAPQNTQLSTLETMRQTLLQILAYLRPFGRPAPEGGLYKEFGERIQ